MKTTCWLTSEIPVFSIGPSKRDAVNGRLLFDTGRQPIFPSRVKCCYQNLLFIALFSLFWYFRQHRANFHNREGHGNRNIIACCCKGEPGSNDQEGGSGTT